MVTRVPGRLIRQHERDAGRDGSRRRAAGTTAGEVVKFLGVPYAAAPVGPLRWRPPQAAARWSGVRDAATFGQNCVQPDTPLGVLSSFEDCLYQNVYAPARRQDREGARVMVWIHGGGWWLGEGNDYDPSQLAPTAWSWSPSTTGSARWASSPTRSRPTAQAA